MAMANGGLAWARRAEAAPAPAHRIAEPPPKGAGLYVVRGGRTPRRRVYVDTSVFGGCFEDGRREGSLALFAAAERGAFTIVVSKVVRDELEGAPQAVRDILNEVPQKHLEDAPVTREVCRLAKAYLNEGVLTEKSWNDARHIAVAAIARVDMVASWNQKHMTRPDKVMRYHEINRRLGYPAVSIRKPTREAQQLWQQSLMPS